MLLYQVDFFVNGAWDTFDAIFEMEPTMLSHFIEAYKGEIIDGHIITVNEIRVRRYMGERPEITMVYDGERIAGTHIESGDLTSDIE